VTKRSDGPHLGRTGFDDALRLETLVADGQHLVDDEYVGIDVDGNGEASRTY